MVLIHVSNVSATYSLSCIKSGRLVSPLDYLIQVYQDEDKPEGVRLAAAKAAIPYLHSAKPTQINQTIQSPDSLFEINLVSPDKD